MIPAGRIRWLRTCAPVLLLAFLSLSCGIGGTDYSGGGTGGTGISTGSVSGYGSVVVNDVHFTTNSKTKKISNGKDNSAMIDQELFRVGMVVTVRYSPGDNTAQVIEYRDNLRGPVAEITIGGDNVIRILGQAVVVENAATVASLKQGDVVEVSGFVDNAGRIRASYIFTVPPPLPPHVQEFEIKGFVSDSSSNGFRLGPLPDGSGTSVTVSFPPGGPANGTYVQVITSDREPVGGGITATRIETLSARTSFPDGVPVDLSGLVTTPWTGSGNDLSFEVEGKRVVWTATTEFVGGAPVDSREPNRKVKVQGMEHSGVLSAARIVFR